MQNRSLEEAVAKILKKKQICLDIGCGPTKKADHIGIDKTGYPSVDLIGDVFEVMALFPADSVDAIYSAHFAEHLQDPATFLSEIVRVLKSNGTAEIIAPHFSNPYFYSDLTHKTFFGLYTLSYFTSQRFFAREVPCYYRIDRLHLLEVTLVFRSARPFYFRHAIKNLIQFIVNCTRWGQEFYEENLVWLCPAYEIRYTIQKNLLDESSVGSRA